MAAVQPGALAPGLDVRKKQTVSFWSRTHLHQVSFAFKRIDINNKWDYCWERFVSIRMVPHTPFWCHLFEEI
jgi:hypothetical protein